jgi:hypothetical protein
MSLELVVMTAFIDWCGYHPPHKVGPPPPHQFILENFYYVGLSGLLLSTAMTHPTEAFSLKYGPFMLLPAVRILTGLYYNNTTAPAGEKITG